MTRLPGCIVLFLLLGFGFRAYGQNTIKPEDIISINDNCINKAINFHTYRLKRAYSYRWTFGDPASGVANYAKHRLATHTFTQAGDYEILLEIRHRFKVSRVRKIIHIDSCVRTNNSLKNSDGSSCLITTENTFSPAGDVKTFSLKSDCTFEKFELTIYNQIGAIVFRTEDHRQAWNGQLNNTGDACPAGRYVYQVRYSLTNSVSGKTTSEDLTGIINLVR